jgi:hypothetical protein
LRLQQQSLEEEKKSFVSIIQGNNNTNNSNNDREEEYEEERNRRLDLKEIVFHTNTSRQRDDKIRRLSPLRVVRKYLGSV